MSKPDKLEVVITNLKAIRTLVRWRPSREDDEALQRLDDSLAMLEARRLACPICGRRMIGVFQCEGCGCKGEPVL